LTTNWVRRVARLFQYMRLLWWRLRLWWRLLRDPRVPDLFKLLLPGLALVYVLWPGDILPDIFPFFGQLDDVAVALLALRLFESFVPPSLLREHWDALRGRKRPHPEEDSEVIDAEYRVL
jgi:uncharacterized membrane protein YkvA (DUF1232 family)